MHPDFDLIIFDCDGTLVDSETLNNRALCTTLAELGLTQYDEAYAARHFVGRTLSNIVLSLQMETGFQFPADIVPRVIKRTGELQAKGLLPVPDAYDVVEKCGRALKTCVASNGERNNVVASLRLTGLLPLFTEKRVFTKGEVKWGKPAPDLFLYAAASMGADPARTLVIEDSPTGVVAGVAAGMKVWGFTGMAHDREQAGVQLQAAGAERATDRLIHIPELLGL